MYIFIASVFLTSLLLYLFIPILKKSFLDIPNSRSSHTNPTPRGGGAVFVLVSLVFSIFAISTSHLSILHLLPLLSSPLAFVGFLDDRRNLSPAFRFFVQITTAVFITLSSPLVQPFYQHTIRLSFPLLLAFTLLVISFVAVVNFVNFMDGVDGLVAGCFLVVFSISFFQSASYLPFWSLVGSLLGFLFFNWSPAKVFMGDAGSTFLGSIFAGYVLYSSTWSQAFGLLLVCTPLLGDSCSCVIRRMLSGHRIFEPHKLHLYQRLHQSGWSHSFVASVYSFSTLILAIIFCIFDLPFLVFSSLSVIVFGWYLDRRYAQPFNSL